MGSELTQNTTATKPNGRTRTSEKGLSPPLARACYNDMNDELREDLKISWTPHWENIQFFLMTQFLFVNNMQILHLTKVITVHPTFWQLVWKIKTRQSIVLLYTKEEPLPKSLRVILHKQDAQFFKWRGPNKGTLVSNSHIFGQILNESIMRYSWELVHTMALLNALIC